MDLLRPAEYRPAVFAIDLDRLRQRGIRGLIVDLDNTLGPWRSERPTPEAVRWLQQVAAAGIRPCVVSNGEVRRVEAFCRDLGIPCVGGAGKPFRKAFQRALDHLGTRPQETAAVGDQIFTDVLGGNRMGLYTILVRPFSTREFAGTRLVRMVERRLLAWMERNGHLVRE